jgi:hypothetical protein
MARNSVLRLVFSVALVPTGALLVILAGPGRVGQLVNSLGLALIVTGILNAFREVAVARMESEENAVIIADRLQERMLQILPTAAQGIRLASKVRRGYDGYYTWATTIHPRDLFFAGRSVLHRIDADFRNRGLPRAEQVLLRKLHEGSVIRIMFLDPRSGLLSRLAREEGQTEEEMLRDITTSLGICRRLYELLKHANFVTPTELSIRIYDDVPYFAYHRDGADVVIGFYFLTVLGYHSAAYSVLDEDTKGFFEGHFRTIFDRSSQTVLLDIAPSSGKASFNTKLFDEVCAALSVKIGLQECENLLRGS